MKNNNLPKNITGIIKEINKTTDINTISELENILACYFVTPLLFIGSLLNYCLYYMLLHKEITYVLKDSMFLLLLSLVFTLIPYFKFNVTIKTHLISLLYSIILIYITMSFYKFMGSSILTLSFIGLSISMARITRTMQIYIGITTFFIGMYVALVLSKISYDMGNHYYILQISFFFLLFFIGSMVHTITIARYKRINQLFIREVERSEEIESLYEEVIATEEELYQQYNQLNENNKQIKLNEETLIHLAHFDSLTELPNRKMIMDQLSLLIENSSKTSSLFYIAFIDIDNFKKVNDTMGHYIGDMFIKSAAIRLKNSIHESDIIGRIGGDEFALIVERNINEESVYQFIETIRKDFSKPFHIENSVIRSTASIGIAIYPKDGEDIVELIKNADTSMYKAKERGKNIIQFFESSMKQEMLEKINFENKLLKAYHTHEFYLVFQPIYKLNSMKIRGFEALLRWNSSDLGMVSPEKFIPIAEEMGLIISLGEWVLREACLVFKQLKDKYNIDAIISVNISVAQLMDEKFMEMVNSVLKSTGLDPKLLEIEITESLFIESFNKTCQMLTALKEMNINISLDDFGTGYSSLSYLRLLPIDILKIDKSFVDDLAITTVNKEIIGDIIRLAHNLDILVIAEGIEHKAQLNYLKNLGCDYIQGFLLGKPMDITALEKLIEIFPYDFAFLENNHRMILVDEHDC